MRLLIYLITLFCFQYSAFAGLITINSINTVNPTCVNNGSVTINAIEGAPALGLLYSISGPINATNATGVFNSLPAGNYYVKAYNIGIDSAIQTITLTSSYSAPIIQRVDTIKPYCDDDFTGSITGIIQSGTGFAPFQWRLDTITGATIRPFQSSATFSGLPRGSYNLILQDCANTISYTVIFPTSGNEFRSGLYTNGFPTAEKMHCDTFMIRFGINHNLIDYKPPYRLRIATPNGNYWYNHSDITFMQDVGNVWFVSQKVGNIDYGDAISVAFYNACDDSITFNRTIARVEDMNYYFNLQCSGNVSIQANYYDSRPNLMITGLFAPVRFRLIDAATTATVFDETRTRTQAQILFEQFGYESILGVTMNNIPNNATYYFIMEDACGLIFRDTIVLNAVQQPMSINTYISYTNGCLDSVIGAIHVQLYGFNAPTLTVLSGPPTLQSTNPMYAYNDINIYPKSFTSVSDLVGGNYLGLWNVAAGTYHVRITDICGRQLDTFFVVNASSITGLYHNFNYTPGCGNNNTINFTLGNSYTDNVTIRRVGGSNIFSGAMYANSSPLTVNIPNQPAGIYVVEYYLNGAPSSVTINSNPTCSLIRDTLIIGTQSTPQIQSYNVALCNANYVVEIIPRTSVGVPPFEYQLEDAMGNVTGFQNEVFFTVAGVGNYTATIRDDCGNLSNYNISVNNIDYNLINFSGSNCVGDSARIQLVYSPYIRYDVIYPSGLVSHSSTITINPILPESEGWYSIYKYLRIGDCYDTLSQFYYFDVNVCTLPVEFISFDGVCKQNAISLTWKTASENNNHRFEIEQSSDAVTFTTIGTVFSESSFSNSIKEYQHTFKTDYAINYFRIKQIDIDSKSTYTKIIQVRCNDEITDLGNEIQIFPNPASNIITLIRNAIRLENITIVDVIGNVILQQYINDCKTSIDISHLANGSYFVLLNQKNAFLFIKK